MYQQLPAPIVFFLGKLWHLLVYNGENPDFKIWKKLPDISAVQMAPKWTRFFASEIWFVFEILLPQAGSASYNHSCF